MWLKYWATEMGLLKHVVTRVLIQVLRPLRDFLSRVANWVLENLLIPTISRLHKWGILEASCWSICCCLILDSIAFPPESASFVALTGIALSGPCLAYSAVVHASLIRPRPWADSRAFSKIINGYIVLTVAPVAILHASNLLGWLTVLAAYGFLGFSVACCGLCWYIGFEDENAIERVAVTSLSLLVGFTVLHWTVTKGDPLLLAPFESACTIMGSITLFLALLIASSLHYSYPHYGNNWKAKNALMLVLLVVGLFAGHVSGMHGLANTSTVFCVLWSVEKWVELHLDLRWNGWLLMLLLSLIMYKAALWLHDHPEFVVSCFGWP